MTELFIHALWDWRGAIASPYGPPNPTTRHVLLTIALHMSPAGDSSFPTVELLAKETKLGRSTVLEHTAKAQAQGWLGKRERAERNKQGWRRIEYIPLIPAGVEAKVKAWREERRGAYHEASEKRGPVTGPRQGGPARTERGPVKARKVVQHPDPNTPSNSPSKPATAPGESYPQGAAAALIWPPKIPNGQRAAIEHYLRANPSRRPQMLLDELEGVMRDEGVRDPVAFFLHIAKQEAAGKFLPSHAHRVQVEREGEQARRELEAQSHG